MLQRRSADAIRCLQQAEQCDRRAAQVTDPEAKRSFLDIAERWRRIAETSEYIDSVNRFLGKRAKG